jgi:hypothetical protein
MNLNYTKQQILNMPDHQCDEYIDIENYGRSKLYDDWLAMQAEIDRLKAELRQAVELLSNLGIVRKDAGTQITTLSDKERINFATWLLERAKTDEALLEQMAKMMTISTMPAIMKRNITAYRLVAELIYPGEMQILEVSDSEKEKP